jgi:hypothetical protein
MAVHYLARKAFVNQWGVNVEVITGFHPDGADVIVNYILVEGKPHRHNDGSLVVHDHAVASEFLAKCLTEPREFSKYGRKAPRGVDHVMSQYPSYGKVA